MLYANPGRPFEALAENADPGLVGTLTVEVYDPTDGTVLVPATTAGITEPEDGTYRAELTVAVTGTYLVRWQAPTLAAEEEVFVHDYRPLLVDVGALMRARTVDDNGVELGTFTDATRPTGEDVDGYIDRALPLVAARLGDVRPSLFDAARTIVALRVAMMVETGHFPQDADPEQSAFASYREQYREAIVDYDMAVDRNVGQGKAAVASVRMPTIVSLESDAQRAGTTLYPPAP